MQAGYKVALPKAMIEDNRLIDAYIALIVRDMPSLAEGFHPLLHETVPGSETVRWIVFRLAEYADDGTLRAPTREELWDRVIPFPNWATGAHLVVTVEIRSRGQRL